MQPARHDLEVTFVMFRFLDPRRSLVAGIIWLVVALATSFAVAASLWAGSVAREIVVQQHVRRLALETDQLASDVGQAVSARLEAIRAAGALPPAKLFEQLGNTYPHLGWLAAADSNGTVISGDRRAQEWISRGLAGLWIEASGDLAAPVRDSSGGVLGVIGAHLSWHWALDAQRLSQALNPRGSAQTVILNTHAAPGEPRFERTPSGDAVLVASAPISISGESGNWQVQLSESKDLVYQRANALAIRILWISISLGAATALLGALGASHLTNRLKRLTRSAAAVGRSEATQIELPSGRDEVAQLAAAFAKVLDDLRQERSELERRVTVRTREVERLAEESRYAAIVRERLQIARDLHDTLAHSMMAMLSEVRLLRKLQTHDPNSLPVELERAEEVAHAGLIEARSAITQMRGNSVRDIGLGPALSKSIEQFKDRTGLQVEFSIDKDAARFGDERAAVIFRMTEEALRNIERHAGASKVRISVHNTGDHLVWRIEDDGVGFDPEISRPGHFGLVGLREQAQLISADLQISSTANRGSSLTLRVRVAPEAL
jgi:signal transduction histidine kinase